MEDPKLISKNDSQRYVIQVTLPSGQKFVMTEARGKLALLAQTENSIEGQVLAFDTPDQANLFLKEIREKNKKEFEEIWKMGPKIIPISRIQ